MRRWLLVLVVVSAVAAVACQRKQRRPEGRFRAVGTIVLDGVAGDDTAGWGTEAEVMVSRAAILDVVERLGKTGHRLDPELLRRAASARHLPDTRILEVSVRLDDADVASTTCNMLLDGYLRRRLTGGGADAVERQLADELEKLRAALGADGGRDPVIEQRYTTTLNRLSEVQLAARQAVPAAHLLDPCLQPRPARSK